MEDLEEDEDVVLEGSTFHVMLQDAGYTDFQPTLINRRRPFEASQYSSKLMERLRTFFARTVTLNVFDNTKASHLSGKQISTILQSETLLDDHAEFVANLLEKNSHSCRNKLAEWSTLITSSVILGASYLMHERKKMLLTLLASSMAAFAVRRKYDEFCAVGSLKNLVSLQNELHRLYKKGLRILSKGCRVGTNSKQSRSAFSNLDTDRLKYIQPLTETVLKSFSSVSRIYYKTSMMLVKILPKNGFDDFFTRFEDEVFEVDGEISYKQFKKLYYVYMMTQSDAMQLLAVAYDADTWIGTGRIPHSRLTRIIFHLYRLVKIHKMQLERIVQDYESCKPRPVSRTFRGPRSSKWRDLYLNLDLLSRKVATAYDAIGAILEDIERHGDSAPTADDDFILELTPRINEIYKQIDTARNFAEFSDLLMAMLKRSVGRAEKLISERSPCLPEIASELTIVRDSDPLIIDEVFEEYITEEYLKPLYDESDEAGQTESAKLDKLLAKNFMAELKEALVDKCKSMSEREAKALLRKHQGASNGDAREKLETADSSIPRPPPLPPVLPQSAKPRVVAAKREKREFRSPVPLPRANPRPKIPEDISSDSVVVPQLPLPAHPFPPPLPPPLPKEDSGEDERFSINLPTIGPLKIPAFVTFEEEFIGSGENSEDESANNDNEEDVEPTGNE